MFCKHLIYIGRDIGFLVQHTEYAENHGEVPLPDENLSAVARYPAESADGDDLLDEGNDIGGQVEFRISCIPC